MRVWCAISTDSDNEWSKYQKRRDHLEYTASILYLKLEIARVFTVIGSIEITEPRMGQRPAQLQPAGRHRQKSQSSKSCSRGRYSGVYCIAIVIGVGMWEGYSWWWRWWWQVAEPELWQSRASVRYFGLFTNFAPPQTSHPPNPLSLTLPLPFPFPLPFSFSPPPPPPPPHPFITFSSCLNMGCVQSSVVDEEARARTSPFSLSLGPSSLSSSLSSPS